MTVLLGAGMDDAAAGFCIGWCSSGNASGSVRAKLAFLGVFFSGALITFASAIFSGVWFALGATGFAVVFSS